jgi:hypothetical protein
MTFDPQHVGFTWPRETTLMNPAGQSMVVRPYAANFAGLQEAGGRRIEECYRYYTSTNGILTELEVKSWIAGGDAACSKLLSAFRALFSAAPGTRLTLEQAIGSLQREGFADNTIEVNLRWLLQDGYVGATRDGDRWILEIVKW